MQRRAILEYRRFDEATGNQSSMIQLIQGMQEIKLNNSERRRRWEWEAIQARLFRIAVKGMAVTQWQTTGGGFINELKNILITFVAARAVIDGQLTIGMMLSIQYIIGQLNAPIANFLNFAQTLQDARISLDRLAEIHARDNEEEYVGGSLTVLPQDRTISISGDLSFNYGGVSGRPVLQDLNLTIPEGKVTAIVGPSGSGKTTLLKLLLQFYQPNAGAHPDRRRQSARHQPARLARALWRGDAEWLYLCRHDRAQHNGVGLGPRGRPRKAAARGLRRQPRQLHRGIAARLQHKARFGGYRA